MHPRVSRTSRTPLRHPPRYELPRTPQTAQSQWNLEPVDCGTLWTAKNYVLYNLVSATIAELPAMTYGVVLPSLRDANRRPAPNSSDKQSCPSSSLRTLKWTRKKTMPKSDLRALFGSVSPVP